MATQPLGAPKFRAFDSSGNPLSGGKLYSYSAGTVTPLATYTTRAGDVANANPVILDANGEANVWMTPNTLYKFALYNSSNVLQWTVDNFPAPAETDTTSAVTAEPGGRLTLTTAVPVTTSDVTGATTVYYTPYKHTKVPIYDGTTWALQTFAELSQTTTDTTKSPAAVANNSNYDLFVWNDSGTIRLSRGPAWTSDTARGTGAGTTQITQLNGRYVNAVSITNGPAANRGTYVGTVRSNGSAQLNDSAALRHVWNMSNRIPRLMRVLESTNSWTYDTTSFRQANGSAANQLDVVRGLDEDAMTAVVNAKVSCNASTGLIYAGVGLDSTTALASGFVSTNAVLQVLSLAIGVGGSWTGLPGLGRHYLAWLEYGKTATTTWYGDNGGVLEQSGIYGSCLA